MPVDQLSIREAWKQIPSPGSVEAQFERFTGKRMERILHTVVAIGSLIVGVQAALAAVAQFPRMDTADFTLLVLVFVPLLVMLVACVLGRGVRTAATSFVFLYLGALITWPIVTDQPDLAASDQPWVFFLVNVSSVAALLAFALPMQFAYALVVPVVYGLARVIQGDFRTEFWVTTGFDVSFMIIFGLVLVALGWMFRSVATGVDDVRGRAVSAYASAAAATAAEQERMATAALMHDSVLAALIALERAETPRSRELGVAMAREALTRLANTEAAVLEEGSDEPVSEGQIVAELRRALSERGADAVVEVRGGQSAIPGRAARALVLAARQAIGNAITHAGGRGLHVLVDVPSGGGIAVAVADAGPGFNMDAVSEDRLGIRASIVARMAAVAGTARIDTGAAGTTVELAWSPR